MGGGGGDRWETEQLTPQSPWLFISLSDVEILYAIQRERERERERERWGLEKDEVLDAILFSE